MSARPACLLTGWGRQTPISAARGRPGCSALRWVENGEGMGRAPNGQDRTVTPPPKHRNPGSSGSCPKPGSWAICMLSLGLALLDCFITSLTLGSVLSCFTVGKLRRSHLPLIFLSPPQVVLWCLTCVLQARGAVFLKNSFF